MASLGLDKKRNQAEARGAGEKPGVEVIRSRLSQLRGYRWSSYRAYAGYVKAPTWLNTTEILKRASRTPSERRKSYGDQARGRVKRGMDEGEFERFKDVLALGGADFVRCVRERMSDPEPLASVRKGSVNDS